MILILHAPEKESSCIWSYRYELIEYQLLFPNTDRKLFIKEMIIYLSSEVMRGNSVSEGGLRSPWKNKNYSIIREDACLFF